MQTSAPLACELTPCCIFIPRPLPSYTQASSTSARDPRLLAVPGLLSLPFAAREKRQRRSVATRLDQRVLLVGFAAVLALAGVERVDLVAAGGVRACLAGTPNRSSRDVAEREAEG